MTLELKLALKLIAAVAAAIGAWEMKGRLKRRNEKFDAELQDAHLQASMTSCEGDKTVSSVATVQHDQGQYRLSITSDINRADEVVIEEVFASRDALEKFLNEHTNFRLGDFVRR